MLVGLLAGSISIVLDAVNNFTDAFSSVIAVIGTKLAARHPDEGHPYGHGRIEYITTFFIGAIIFAAGVIALIESVPKIIHPELANYSLETIIVVALAVITKLVLSFYVQRAGRHYDSSSLVASGIDAFFDAILSAGTLVGIIVTLLFQVSIDGVIGAMIAIFIIRSSVEIILDSFNDILGQAADRELMRKIKKLVCSFPEVHGAYDLMLHNYGPTETIGSVQIQVSDQLTASTIHRLTQEIAHQVFAKYGINLTVGIYAENDDLTVNRELYDQIINLSNTYPEIHQIHGLYIDDESKLVTFDLVMSIRYPNKTTFKNKIIRQLRKVYPSYKFLVMIDLDLEEN